jgi:acyl carrier protein
MNDQDILGLIQEALHDVAPSRTADFKNITMSTTIESLALDSIATMEMVGFLEDKTETTFPDEKLATVTTMADLAALVRENQPA